MISRRAAWRATPRQRRAPQASARAHARAERGDLLQHAGTRRPIRMRRRSMRSVPYLSAVFGLVDEDAAPGDHGAQHAALDGPAVVRRVLRFGTESVDVNAPGPLEIKNSEVGGAADLE